MKTVSKHTFRRSLLASACVIAISGGAHAQISIGQPTASYGLWFGAGAGAEATVTLRDYVMAVTVPQQNFAPVAAEAFSVSNTLQLAGAQGGATTLAGNRIAAAAAGNRNTTGIDLGLLQAGLEGQAGIGAIVSQVQGGAYVASLVPMPVAGGVVANVADARIGIRAEGGAPQAGVSANAIAAEAVLNQSSTSLAGELAAAAQAGWQAAGSGVTQAGWTSEASSTGLLNAGTFQAAAGSQGYGAGAGATVTAAEIGLSVAGGSQQPLNVDGNAITARHGANQASTVIDARSAAGGLQGSAVVTNAQSTLGGIAGPVDDTPFPFFTTTDFPASTANASVRDATISAEVHGGGDVQVFAPGYGGGLLQGALSVSGNLVGAEAGGNSAGQRGAAGIEAGNVVRIAGAPVVTGSGSGAMVRLGSEGDGAEATVVADLVALNSQLNRANGVGAEVQGGIVAAGADGIGRTGSVSLRDNALRATATGNLAGNRVDVQAGAFSASAAAANLQVNQDSAVRAGQQYVGVTARSGFDAGDVQGTVSLTGNRIVSAADANVAATDVAVEGATLRGNGAFMGDGSTGADTWYGARAGTGAAVSASNAQTHGGWSDYAVRGLASLPGLGNDVTATVEGGFVSAELGEGGARVDGATVNLQGNAIAARAGANTAANGVVLAGSDVAARAAVVNAQSSQGSVAAAVVDSGIAAVSGGLANGAVLAVGGNRVAAEAAGNQADNTLRAAFERLDATSPSYYPFGASLDNGMAVQAAQAIASEQRHSGYVAADAQAVGIAAVVGRSGAADSRIAVQDNQVAASARANVANNAIVLEGGTIGRDAYGWGGAVAGISNAQRADGASHAAIGSQEGGPLAGATIVGAIDRGSVAVTGNAVAAGSVGNTAANRLDVEAGSLQSNIGFGVLAFNAGEGGGTDFAVANVQQDQAWRRSAEARGVQLAIDLERDRQPAILRAEGNRVSASTLALTGNNVTAEARSNDATNGLALGGFGQLAGSGLVLNTQMGETQVEAVVEGARLRIHGDRTTLADTQLNLSANRVQAVAVGASASNSLSAQAQDLGGTTVFQPTFGVAGVASVAGVAPVAASNFAVQNSQSQQGAVTAVADAAMRIRFAGSTMEQGSASVQGNRIEALAQATSASNTLELAGMQVGAGASVTSQQTTEATVAATLQSQGRNTTVGIETASAYGTTLAVKDNTLRASAGQNEAFNSLALNATGATGSHAILNAQSGSGFVGASAQPRFVGVDAGAVGGAPVTVSGNTVAAQASFNTAANGLSLAGAATGSVRNEQVTGYGAASASVGGDAGLLVGVGQSDDGRNRDGNGYGWGTVLNGAAAAVSGNSVVADAAGNTAASTLNVAAAAVRYGFGPAYSVLNSQTNGASLSATVSNTSVGVSAGAMYGATGTVAGNQVQAQATGNKASNVVGFGANLQPGLGQAAIQNVQFNNASINAAVRGVTVGAGGGYGAGGSLAVQGNVISSQATGNSAVNMLTIK